MAPAELLQALREETLPRLPAARDALEKARASSNLAELGPVRELLHKLAGTAALGGLHALGRLARLGEDLAIMAIEGDVKPNRRLFDSLGQVLSTLETDLEPPKAGPAPVTEPVVVFSDKPGDGRVVVASDESVSAKLMMRFLEEAGFQPRRCSLADAGSSLPDCDLVLVDVPVAEAGFPLADAAVTNAAKLRIPVLVTAKGDPSAGPLKALAAKASALLSKPVLPEQLEQSARTLIDRRRAAAAARARAPTAQNPSPAPAPGTKRLKVLIVDDSRVIRGVVREALSEVGLAVVEAEDGAEALAVFDAEKPDAVISDVQMPGVDGAELTRLLRLRQKGVHVPIVVLSALEDEGSRAAGLKAGADAYLVKSLIDGAALLQALARAGLKL